MEVRRKLYQMGCMGEEAEELLVKLIEQNFLNEERYAKAYTGGKFRIKGWGKVKIRNGLLQAGISERMILESFRNEIKEEDYRSTALKAAESKAEKLSDGTAFERFAKVADHLMRRGFESDLAKEMAKRVVRL